MLGMVPCYGYRAGDEILVNQIVEIPDKAVSLTVSVGPSLISRRDTNVDCRQLLLQLFTRRRGEAVSVISEEACSLQTRVHSVTSLWRWAWHSIVTATGSDVMWQGYVRMWMANAVVSPPYP